MVWEKGKIFESGIRSTVAAPIVAGCRKFLVPPPGTHPCMLPKSLRPKWSDKLIMFAIEHRPPVWAFYLHLAFQKLLLVGFNVPTHFHKRSALKLSPSNTKSTPPAPVQSLYVICIVYLISDISCRDSGFLRSLPPIFCSFLLLTLPLPSTPVGPKKSTRNGWLWQ